MASANKPAGEFSNQETKRRAVAALRVALNTPPKPHELIGKKKRSPKPRKTSAAAAKRGRACRRRPSGFQKWCVAQANPATGKSFHLRQIDFGELCNEP